MKSIEFVGPSGIGKTTFLQNLVEARNDSSWMTWQEGLSCVKNNERLLLKRIIRKFSSVAGAPLHLQNGKDHIEILKRYEEQSTLLVNLFINNLQISKLQGWQKIKLYDYYICRLLPRIIKLHEICDNTTILLDEGIIHNGGTTYILNDFETYKHIVHSPLYPKAAVFFNLNLNDYRKRLYSRFNDKGRNTINSLMLNVKDSDLDDFMLNGIKSCENKFKACSKLGIPIIQVEADTTSYNIQKVLNFIKKVTSQT